MSREPRSAREQWDELVELQRSGRTRVVADLRDPDAFLIFEQEGAADGWRMLEGAARPISLTRAAVERLIVAVGFR